MYIQCVCIGSGQPYKFLRLANTLHYYTVSIQYFQQVSYHTHSHIRCAYMKGWPKLYICTIYDSIFDFPAKNTVFTPYIYIYIILANPTHMRAYVNTFCASIKPANWLGSFVGLARNVYEGLARYMYAP